MFIFVTFLSKFYYMINELKYFNYFRQQHLFSSNWARITVLY